MKPTMGLLFLAIFIFGFWLSRSGKPYSAILFNLHKLIALGAVIYLAVSAYNIHKATPLGAGPIAAIIVTILCFATSIITGGLISVDKAMPAWVSVIHKLFPYLSVLFTALTLFLLPAKP